MLNLTSLLSLLTLATLMTLTEAQAWKKAFKIPEFLVWGKCAKTKELGALAANFSSDMYAGLWFDIESVPNEYQYVKKCVTQNYIWTGEQMQVQTRGLTVDDEKIKQTASMAIEMETEPINDPAHMTVTAEGVPAAPYQIIDTDYHNYACVYSCMSFVGFKAEFSWIFARAPVLAQEFIDKCHNKLTEMNVDPSLMLKIVQADVCPYWPKLPKMLEDSKTQLTKVLGPDSQASGSSPSKSIDEMQAIISSSKSSGSSAAQDVAPKVHTTSKNAGSDSSSSSSSHSDDQGENRAPHMISSAYLLTIITTVVLATLMH